MHGWLIRFPYFLVMHCMVTCWKVIRAASSTPQCFQFFACCEKMVSLALDLWTWNQTEAKLWGCNYSAFLVGGRCWNRHFCVHLYILCVCKNSSVFQINASSLLVILTEHYFETKIILHSLPYGGNRFL